MDAATIDVDPFAGGTRRIAEPSSVHARLRAAGPLVRAVAPEGGPVWIVTDDALAREVLSDPRIVKDPACAPAGWRPAEPPAADQPSLTTLDGSAHTELRRAHIPSFTARRMQAHAARAEEIAHRLLGGLGRDADLAADLTVRYPTTVICDLLAVPDELVDDAVAAFRGMYDGRTGAAMGAFARLAAAALASNRGPAAELRERLPGAAEGELRYHLFGLLFAGQLTTDAALGFLLAEALGPGRATPVEDLVTSVLRRHPPAPFSLWRYTATAVEIAGVAVPARSPVLVAIESIHLGDGPDLTFGAGQHFCVGAQLALVELRAVVDVLRRDFPDARLTVPYDELRCVDAPGIEASRVVSLPVRLR